MGQVFGHDAGANRENSSAPVETVNMSSEQGWDMRKRQSDQSEDDSIVRKRKKLDTPRYIHKRLFIDGDGSDITVCALGRTWNLHRLYLEQCKFFDSLFRGSWKDSNDSVLNIDVVDTNITADGLHKVLESLYHNEIEIDSDNLLSLVASASMLSLDSVLDRCSELCIESLCDDRVWTYLSIAEQYGMPELLTKCYEYIKFNFWRLSRDIKVLSSINYDTMKKLISSPDLLIIEGEMDLYETIRTWIFLQNVECINENEIVSEIKKFYLNLTDLQRSNLCVNYANICSQIRLNHIVTSVKTINLLRGDPLVPNEVVDRVLVERWMLMLKSEEENTRAEINDETFNKFAHRLGRILDSSPKCWRWSGFNFGVDLLLNFGNGILTLKRNCLSQSTPYSVSLKTEREIHYRVIIANRFGKCLVDSSRQVCSLRIDQTVIIARLKTKPEDYPLSIHFFHLTMLPLKPMSALWEPFLAHNSTLED